MGKKYDPEMIDIEELEKEKKRIENNKKKERIKKEQKELNESVTEMQNKIKETNEILFGLLKVSIFFLVSVIIIILIKRAMG